MIDKNINRIFTFGCSFTKFVWETWPGILAYELDVPLYNYGQSGAGNLFISNTVSQADTFYKFTEKDLVIVCWSSVCREDRWINGWVTPGNIYTQNVYPKQLVKSIDPLGCLVRDLGLIHMTKSLLENTTCQWYFLSMNDLAQDLVQFSNIENVSRVDSNFQNYIIQTYENVLQSIIPSFYKVLWNNNLENKINYNKKVCPTLHDFHPLPIEHCNYLNTIFPNIISNSTRLLVEEKNSTLIGKINGLRQIDIYGGVGKFLYDLSYLKKSEEIKII